MRYVSRPRAMDDWGEANPIPAPQFQIEPTPAHKTGLLDAKGNEIWAEPDPIGFRFEANDRKS